jgi:hypothetical protein
MRSALFGNLASVIRNRQVYYLAGFDVRGAKFYRKGAGNYKSTVFG